ncbi:HutD family protein [Lichenihabitans sp. Uapishka_5]|uniref:HutD/Ves family protein n=1 Tax=Lichenihabitans sp. Uapishka_5 TaxID=3037302 RepID=UPI0029E80504|nr:HutD family protein [Lichenihabitans sp. Uapishka_5]MDX7951071.1 HutD family protein [Lichenihabitans sp. Uapishka_5]
MRIVRAADCRRMPWKNGGGETIEIAVEPAGAGLEDFAWRLSSATVASDGPFSAFAGIDRTLALLSGAGLQLDVGGGAYRLQPGDDPLAFPGDVPTAASLLDGPISDLNMMTRRGSWRHAMHAIRLDGVLALPRQATTTLVFCADGQVQVEDAVVAAQDLAILASDPEPVRLAGLATLYVVTIDKA